MKTLPITTESKLTKKQTRVYGPKEMRPNGAHIRATVRFDDECGNGHNSFSITGSTTDGQGGCIHDLIAEHFPELQPFIKWHLCSTDGPMHYPGNVLYHAGDKDCWGLRKGEFRQHTSRGKLQNGGIEGVPNWKLRTPSPQEIYASEKPAPITLEWEPCEMIGKGKERELDRARSSAVWPDATDEDLTADGLKERLEARLPGLMLEFRAAIESLGFTW